jgi:signal transduction histidine kinase
LSRYFSGVRGRVMLTVIAVTAVLYSILGVVGFLVIANSGHDAIRERVNAVIDQLEAGLRNGSSTVQVSTPDGVQASVAGSTSSVPPAPTGEVQVVRTATIRGTALVIVGQASEARLADSLRSLHRGLWLGIPLAVAVTGIMAGIATAKALRPVADITKLAATIDGGDARSRVPVPDSHDEVEQLARTVNEMLDRIGEGLLAQRRFTSDAAHELRTPLMALQGEIEIAKRYPESSDDEFLDRAATLITRLGDRVDDLVLLSALDESRPIDTQSAPLLALVRAEAHDVSATIDVVGDESTIVAIDPRLMARAIRNLLSNAVRHADKTVQATVVRVGERVWLYVDDDGRGIEPAEREHVFQRFGRLDEGRSADAGGAGLGLAIVASVARAHGGDVSVEAGPLAGARFSLWIPHHDPAVDA